MPRPMLDPSLRKQPSLVPAPILPFTGVRQAAIDAVRWRALLVLAPGAQGVDGRAVVVELLLGPEAARQPGPEQPCTLKIVSLP